MNGESFLKKIPRDFLSTFFISLLLAFNYLHRNCYKFYRPEALIFWFVIFGCLAIVFLVCRAMKTPWVLYAFLLILVSDVAFGFIEKAYFSAKSSFGLNKGIGYSAVSALVLVIAFFVYKWRESVNRFFLPGAAVALASAIFFQALAPSHLYASSEGRGLPPVVNQKPNIFFIILDEHIGFAGIPDAGPVAARVRAVLAKRYEKEGFTLFERAYSNYFSTLDSIPSILNGKIYSQRRADVKNKKLIACRLFDQLSREGYRINIYQSTYPDYSEATRGGYQKCFTYRSTATGYLQGLPIGLKAKVGALVSHFVGSSESHPLKKLFRLLMKRQTNEDLMTGALATDRVLEEVKKDFHDQKSGHLFFIHLLIPHSSYVYDSEGRLLDPCRWEESSALDEDRDAAGNTAEGRLRKYSLYFGQVLCLHKKLEKFFDAMKQAGIYNDATVVMMGDHGSRIFETAPLQKNRGRLTDRDLVDAYSAFLAIKPGAYSGALPAGREGSVRTKTPLIKAVGGFFDILSETNLKDGRFEKIYLQTENPAFFEAALMPDFGGASED